MKNSTLFVASIMLFANAVIASVFTRNTDEATNRFNQEEPIAFIEKGIAFFVFPNGEFDFNTHPQDGQGAYYYKAAVTISMTTSERSTQNYGVRIERDCFGRIRRVGNTFINYDNRDRVNRIGSVFMRYNRWAMIQIGGMQLVYNRRGELIDTIGTVKMNHNGYGYSYQNQYEHEDYDDDNHSSEDSSCNNYYYYKANGSKAKVADDQ